MNFAFPIALFLGALAIVIVALYLRRPRRRRMEVSTLMFWQRVLERAPRRRFLGRLRNPFSLLLQLLIFLLLLLALARPDFGRGAKAAVLVLDTRARMQAEDTFSQALAAAKDLVSRAGPGEEVALLAVGGAPRLIAPFSSDARDLRGRLAAIRPSDAGGGMAETLALAQDLLASRAGDTSLVVITDRPAPGASPDTRQILVGAARDNAAVLALASRPIPASPQSAEIFVKLGNYSAQPRDLEFELVLDGRALDLQRVPVPPGGVADYSTVLPAEVLGQGRGLLEARLTGNDALPVDNVARAALPPQSRLRVALVTEGNPFLENALRADPDVILGLVEPNAWRQNLGYDVTVFDNWQPPVDLQGRGRYFFFGRSPFVSSGAELPALRLEETEPASPLLWNADMNAIKVAPARPLAPPPDARVSVPLTAAGEPMLLAVERPGGQRIVATAFGVDSSNIALRAAFPLFVSNAVHWLAGREGTGANAYAAGATYVPENGGEISTAPLGQASSLTKAPVRLEKNGFYETRAPGSPPGWLAVNTADAGESDLRKASSNQAKIPFAAGLALRPWQWLALLAFVLALAEWFLHHRRITE